ncbi:MAG TPA: hypothetical protein VHX11_07785 [Acidobacteriaceae bacterium]|jgi:hypothetical protein|nr:hypothetical protein [Acidobacteriaceae bacterium]
MRVELWNLYFFFAAIFKCALYTGLGPAVLIVYAVEKLVKAGRVPTLHRSGRWLAKVIPIRKPGHPVPRRRKDRRAA